MTFNQHFSIAHPGISVAVALATMAGVTYAEPIHRTDQVVVTAARRAQSVDETLAPVTIINREEIERSQAMTVVEILNQSAPGVQISSSGGPGANSGIYLRGTKTAQTLILMDGQRINTASSGSAPLEYIDPDIIERIEVVRGPRSTLYGADAVGGVINIITRQGAGTPSLTLKAGGGSRKTGEYSVNLNGESDGTRYNVGARLLETQGYDRTLDKTSATDTNSDDDTFRNKTASASLSRRFASGVEAGMNLVYFTGKSEYDNIYNSTALPESHFEETIANVYLSKTINDVWDTKVEAGLVDDSRKDVDGNETNHINNKLLSISWLNDVVWTDNQLLTAGVDFTNEAVDSNTIYTINKRSNTALYAQNLTTLTSGDLQLNGRYDHSDAFGGHLTGGVSWGFDLPANLRLIATYSSAFRAPTFTDMYLQSSFSAPNPDLKPEFSRYAELELRGIIGEQTNWSINVYQNDMDDMLNTVQNTSGKWHTVNIDRARIRGVEFEIYTQLAGIDLNTNLSFVDPENRSGIDAGKKLHYRAQQLFALNVDKNVGCWSLGGTFRAQGKTWTDPGNTVQIPGYGTVDLRGSFNLTNALKTQLKATNLFDKHYQPVVGYRGEPRGIFATVIWSPEL